MDKPVKLAELIALWGLETIARHVMIGELGELTFIFFEDGRTAILRYIGPYNVYTEAEVLNHGNFLLNEDPDLGEMARLLYE